MLLWIIKKAPCIAQWARQLSRYSDWLRDGRSGDRILVVARFSAPVQNGPGAHPVSCSMGAGSFPRVKSGRGVTLTRHLLLGLWSRKSRAKPLISLWAVQPVQSLSACTKVQFFYCTDCTKNSNEFEDTIICQKCFPNIIYCNTSQNIFASSTDDVTYLISKYIKTVIYGNYAPNNLSPGNKSCSRDLGTAILQWLRCCATNRKVAGSIPAGVIGIFHCHKILPNTLWPCDQLSL